MLEERRVNENSLEGITQELAVTKQAVRDLTRREKQLQEFRRAVVNLLGLDGDPGAEGDYEAICRLERVVGAHRELTDLSRRIDEMTAPSRPNRVALKPNLDPALPEGKHLPSPFSSLSPLSRNSSLNGISSGCPNSARTLTSRSPPLRSPTRPSSAAPPYRLDSPPGGTPTSRMDQGFLDMSEELRALADDAHNHRPQARHSRRPPSAHARTPSPTKRPSTDEDEYS
ncbi:uncharacterized protein LOC122251962 [Penaeus japonicus]|uniref:uncharacterized protein LOC122251962 n=1 Tax=Penaeus japonicus TaxID=27405 RepID=UPI001C710E7A|nr:uncharacterized protein LOC122251962 [Penaeus japonicus]